MLQVILVALGGGAGAVCRYLAGEWIVSWATRHGVAFPLATLSVNLVGCLAIGALAGVAESRGTLSDELRLLLVVGYLGGFTTFSSFGNETFQLLRDGDWMVASTNAAIQLLVGVLAVAAGFWVAAR